MLELKKSLINQNDLNTSNFDKIREFETQKKVADEKLKSELENIKSLQAKDFDLSSELDTLSGSIKVLQEEFNLDISKVRLQCTENVPFFTVTEKEAKIKELELELLGIKNVESKISQLITSFNECKLLKHGYSWMYGEVKLLNFENSNQSNNEDNQIDQQEIIREGGQQNSNISMIDKVQEISSSLRLLIAV